MSRGRDWGKSNTRARLQRQGAERADEPTNFMRPLLARRLPIRKPSKTELREQARAAVAEWKSK